MDELCLCDEDRVRNLEELTSSITREEAFLIYESEEALARIESFEIAVLSKIIPPHPNNTELLSVIFSYLKSESDLADYFAREKLKYI